MAPPRTSSRRPASTRCSPVEASRGPPTASFRDGSSSSSAPAPVTQHLPYCSADLLRGHAPVRWRQSIRPHPEAKIYIIYKDMRTPGQIERFYAAVQQQPGSFLTRAKSRGPSAATARSSVRLKDTLLGDDVQLQADLVVLATGMVPNSADGEAIRTFSDASQALCKRRVRDPAGRGAKERRGARSPRGYRNPQPHLPPGAGPAHAALRASPTRTSSASPTRRGAPASTPPGACAPRWTRPSAAEDASVPR